MVHAWNDWASPHESKSTAYNRLLDSIDGVLHMNDTIPNKASWGELVYTGVDGGTDWRNTDGEPFVSFWSEIETPEMCGHVSQSTPSQL
jgi:hypothetical protein